MFPDGTLEVVVAVILIVICCLVYYAERIYSRYAQVLAMEKRLCEMGHLFHKKHYHKWFGYSKLVDSMGIINACALLRSHFGRVFPVRLGRFLYVFISDAKVAAKIIYRPCLFKSDHGVLASIAEKSLIRANGEQWTWKVQNFLTKAESFGINIDS